MRAIQRAAYRVAGHLPAGLKRVLIHMGEARFMVGVLGIVLDGDGRVLLFRHTYRPFNPWGLPSGLMKPGESPGDAIVREIKEETGLDTEVLGIIEVRGRSRPQRVDVWMRCGTPTGVPRLSAEVDEMGFFALDRLPPLIAEQAHFLAEHRDLFA